MTAISPFFPPPFYSPAPIRMELLRENCAVYENMTRTSLSEEDYVFDEPQYSEFSQSDGRET